MAFLKKFILGVLVAILGIGIYRYHEVLGNFYHQSIRKLLTCQSPITYSLGNIDPRFDLDESEILSITNTAEKTWEEAANADLFRYTKAGGTLTIHFIYDARQQMTENLVEISGTIAEKKENYTLLKAKYDIESLAYEKAKNDFEIKAGKLSEENKDYETQVSYWNNLGGAPEQELNKLEEIRKNLKIRLNVLEQEQKKLDKQANAVNMTASHINKLISELNLNVRTYNTVSKTNGEEFEEGEYIRDNEGERIQIYEFANQEKLIRLMVHELGHALGLGHVEDPESIMYRLNQGKGIQLGRGDRDALKVLCKMN